MDGGVVLREDDSSFELAGLRVRAGGEVNRAAGGPELLPMPGGGGFGFAAGRRVAGDGVLREADDKLEVFAAARDAQAVRRLIEIMFCKLGRRDRDVIAGVVDRS